MLDLMNNGWVVGIITGTISGLIVFFITSWIFSNRSKRELIRQAATANREVVNSIRSCIPDGKLPSLAVLDSLIHATSRKYGVSRDSLFSTAEVCEELVKEVMDSSFVSASSKEQYCSDLVKLASTAKIGSLRQPFEMVQGASNDRSHALSMSIMLATSASAMSFYMVFLLDRVPGNDFLEAPSNIRNLIQSIALPTFVAMVAAMVSMISLIAFRRIARKKLEAPFANADEKTIAGIFAFDSVKPTEVAPATLGSGLIANK
jgi:hypothetical protein